MATFPFFTEFYAFPGGKTDPGFLVAINSIRYDPAINRQQNQHFFQEIRKAKGVVARQVPDEAGLKRERCKRRKGENFSDSGDGMIEIEISIYNIRTYIYISICISTYIYTPRTQLTG